MVKDRPCVLLSIVAIRGLCCNEQWGIAGGLPGVRLFHRRIQGEGIPPHRPRDVAHRTPSFRGQGDDLIRRKVGEKWPCT